MGRRPDPAVKEQLRADIGDYVLENGLTDLSLRPLARSLGTSPRMLLYHFGSKESLIMDALEGARQRHRQAVENFLASDPELEPGDLLRRFIPWLTSPGHAPFLRLFFEVYVLALREPQRFPEYLRWAVDDWLALFEDVLSRTTGLNAKARRVAATAGLAGFRGLVLDLLATGDRERVTKAAETLLTALEAHYENEGALRELAT